MTHKLDHFVKKGLLVCIGLAAVSGLLAMSYMDSKNLTFEDIFDEGMMNIHLNSGRVIGDFDDLRIQGNLGSAFKTYDTKELYESDVFQVSDEIKITSSTEDILFVEEDREDIKVTFEREVPDTSRYDLTYEARRSGNQIIVDVDLSTNGFYVEQDYQGLITIYVPRDYHCDRLTIDSSIASHTLGLPRDVDEVAISVDFGSIDITVEEALDVLELSLNAGDLYFESQAPVKVIDVQLDTGELSFDIHESVGNLKLKNNVGEIKGTLKTSPKTMSLDCDLGDVEVEFYEPILDLAVEVNIGDLNIYVSDQDEGLVYIDKDLVDFTSKLETTTKKDRANILLDVDLGDVTIK